MKPVHIHILAIEADLEAQAIRAAAEAWGALVSVSWIGNSQQIVDYFSAPQKSDLIILAAHGDERGLLLPTLADEIRQNYPYQDVITAADFRSFLRIDNACIINSACCAGSEELAQCFLDCGASYYIAATDYPDGGAALMYILSFLYAYLQNSEAIQEAHRQAISEADDRQYFRLFSRQ